jgi:hypothetical protein
VPGERDQAFLILLYQQGGKYLRTQSLFQTHAITIQIGDNARSFPFSQRRRGYFVAKIQTDELEPDKLYPVRLEPI